MKKMFFMAGCALVMFSCEDNKTDESMGAITPVEDTTANANIDYAYQKTSTSNYEMGDPARIAMVLQALKAWETNNMDALNNYFTDTVMLEFDNMSDTLTKDSVIAMFKEGRSNMDSVWIKMHDWETVRSTNDDYEWVSLWYTEYMKPKGGKVDSMAIMDDIRIKEGKIAGISQYQRRFPKK